MNPLIRKTTEKVIGREIRLEEALKQSISLLTQTTEFEVLDSFKFKVSELQKVLEETKT